MYYELWEIILIMIVVYLAGVAWSLVWNKMAKDYYSTYFGREEDEEINNK